MVDLKDEFPNLFQEHQSQGDKEAETASTSEGDVDQQDEEAVQEQDDRSISDILQEDVVSKYWNDLVANEDNREALMAALQFAFYLNDQLRFAECSYDQEEGTIVIEYWVRASDEVEYHSVFRFHKRLIFMFTLAYLDKDVDNSIALRWCNTMNVEHGVDISFAVNTERDGNDDWFIRSAANAIAGYTTNEELFSLSVMAGTQAENISKVSDLGTDLVKEIQEGVDAR